MSIHMAKTIKEERLRWILPIVKQEVKLKDAAKVCPHSKRSLERWAALYREEGEAGLEPKSTEPKTQEKETPIWVKERIVEIRKKTKKCALKIRWQLQFEHKIQAIKTDNGSIFTNYYASMTKRSDMTVKTIHALDIFCRENNIIHYLIDPGKPAQNGTVERSHREDQEKFYEQNKFKSFNDLQIKLERWNIYYNNLEHCGLNGKTPNEFLEDYQLIRPPNVCA